MTERKTRFVELYLRNGGNGTEAAIGAGYSPATAAQAASRLLKDVKVAAAIAERRGEVALVVERETGITVTRVIEELARIAFFDPKLCVDERGKLLPIEQMPEDARRALQSLEVEVVTREVGGELLTASTGKLRFWDKPGALVTIGKHLGAFRDKLPGESDGPTVDPAAVPRLSDGELIEVRKAIDLIKSAAATLGKKKGGRRG